MAQQIGLQWNTMGEAFGEQLGSFNMKEKVAGWSLLTVIPISVSKGINSFMTLIFWRKSFWTLLVIFPYFR